MFENYNAPTGSTDCHEGDNRAEYITCSYDDNLCDGGHCALAT